MDHTPNSSNEPQNGASTPPAVQRVNSASNPSWPMPQELAADKRNTSSQQMRRPTSVSGTTASSATDGGRMKSTKKTNSLTTAPQARKRQASDGQPTSAKRIALPDSSSPSLPPPTLDAPPAVPVDSLHSSPAVEMPSPSVPLSLRGEAIVGPPYTSTVGNDRSPSPTRAISSSVTATSSSTTSSTSTTVEAIPHITDIKGAVQSDTVNMCTEPSATAALSTPSPASVSTPPSPHTGVESTDAKEESSSAASAAPLERANGGTEELDISQGAALQPAEEGLNAAPSVSLSPSSSSLSATHEHQVTCSADNSSRDASFSAASRDEQETEFRWFIRIRDDNDQVQVQWADGSRLWDRLSLLKPQVVVPGRLTEQEWHALVSMANRERDTKKQKQTKAIARKQYWASHPESVPRRSTRLLPSSVRHDAAAVNERTGTMKRHTAPTADIPRRSARLNLSSKRLDTALNDSTKDENSDRAGVAIISTDLDVQHCPACAQLCPGSRCSIPGCISFLCVHCSAHDQYNRLSFICSSHGGPPMVQATIVQKHGSPRPEPVRVSFVCSDVATIARFGEHVDTQAAVDMEGGEVDIVVFVYHSSGLSVKEHIDKINGGLRQRRPTFVLVLSCFDSTHPDVQTEAFRTLATMHHHTTFVTFIDPQLQRFERFVDAFTPLAHSVLFPQARPFVFLASLSLLCPDMVVFADCGSKDPRWAGPLQVAEGRWIPKCTGCAQAYAGAEGRWKKGVSGVRRRVCRRGVRCGDVLVVQNSGQCHARSSLAPE